MEMASCVHGSFPHKVFSEDVRTIHSFDVSLWNYTSNFATQDHNGTICMSARCLLAFQLCSGKKTVACNTVQYGVSVMR
jgi:hypothetical protein